MDGFGQLYNSKQRRHNPKGQVKSLHGIHNVLLVHRCFTKIAASNFLISLRLVWLSRDNSVTSAMYFSLGIAQPFTRGKKAFSDWKSPLKL